MCLTVHPLVRRRSERRATFPNSAEIGASESSSLSLSPSPFFSLSLSPSLLLPFFPTFSFKRCGSRGEPVLLALDVAISSFGVLPFFSSFLFNFLYFYRRSAFPVTCFGPCLVWGRPHQYGNWRCPSWGP